MTTRAAYHSDTALDFLRRADRYLSVGDLLQASEKGWGAAAQAAKSVAEQRGWRHRSHRDLFRVVERLSDERGDAELLSLFHVANSLHQNFYEGWQTKRVVEAGLEGVAEFVRRLDLLGD